MKVKKDGKLWLMFDDADNLRGVFSTRMRGKKKAKELKYRPHFLSLKVDRDRFERGAN